MNIFTRHRLREIPSRVYHACGVAPYFAGSTRILSALPMLAALLFLAFASPSERELPRRGKDFALFIAVNDYQYWGKLKNPISEVEKIAEELYREYDFDTLVLRNPSLDQIITTLRTFSAKSYPDDGQLLIYLSGHGDFDGLTKEGFFIPQEGKVNDVAQNSYLSFSRLQKIVENIPCRHILLAIDACYSGTFDRLVSMRGEPQFGRPGASDERNRFIQNAMTLQSRFFMASGQKEQTPDASNFAAHFLRALRIGGQDHGILTMYELSTELKKANPSPHFSTFTGHQDESNFLFIKSKYVPSRTPVTTTPAGPSSTVPSTTVPADTKPKQPPCVVNQTGDVCVQNARKQKIWVNINGQVRELPPGQKECFYDVNVGTLTFKVTSYKPGGGAYTLGGLTTHQARITACGTASSVIQ